MYNKKRLIFILFYHIYDKPVIALVRRQMQTEVFTLYIKLSTNNINIQAFYILFFQ